MNGQVIPRIGRKIRETRLRQQMKLQEVAEAAQISKGLLSKIENGRTVPSLTVLVAIIQSLKVPMNTFFEGIDAAPTAAYIHCKQADYLPYQKEEATGFLYEHVLSRNTFNIPLEVNLLTLQPGAARGPVTTDGYEFKYMLKGEVEYQLGEETIYLQAGDSLFFNGKIPHVPINRTSEPVSMLVIYLLLPDGGHAW